MCAQKQDLFLTVYVSVYEKDASDGGEGWGGDGRKDNLVL